MPAQTPTMADPSKVLEFVQLSSTFTKRAMDAQTATAQTVKAAEAKIPTVLDAMLKAGSIDETQTELATTALRSHPQTLELLKRAVDRIAVLTGGQSPATKLGQGVDEDPTKQASDVQPVRKFRAIGERTSEKTAADEALFRGLNITPEMLANAAGAGGKW